MMAVLRAAHAPVPRELLTDFSTDITVPDALKVPVQDYANSTHPKNKSTDATAGFSKINSRKSVKTEFRFRF